MHLVACALPILRLALLQAARSKGDIFPTYP